MQKEKVMIVTLMRSDLYDAPGYIGAYLNLPASRDEMQDALDRARIRGGQPYQIVECYNMQGEELDFIPENPSLEALNFLSHRISEMSDYDRMAFTGCVMISNTKPDMRTLINLTYGLTDVRVIPINNDRQLGEFFVEHGFIDAVNHVPLEYQEELLLLLDYEKIGEKQRIAEKGIYFKGHYVMNDADVLNQVYDGVHLPEFSEEPSYVFKLQLVEATFTPEDQEPGRGTALLLPASDKEILAALEKLGVASLEECVLSHCESPIPMLEQVFPFSEDIDKINLLASRIRELEHDGELPKFKAIVELGLCPDIDQALDITQNLDCYDFYPELSSMEEYAKQEFINRYHIPESEPALRLLRFYNCDLDWMQKADVITTSYGILRHNEREMTMDYSIKQAGQQMG